MEAKVSWERKRPERVRGGGGGGNLWGWEVLRIQRQGSLEDGDQALEVERP